MRTICNHTQGSLRNEICADPLTESGYATPHLLGLSGMVLPRRSDQTLHPSPIPSTPWPYKPKPGTQNRVFVKGLYLSCHNKETVSFTTDPFVVTSIKTS